MTRTKNAQFAYVLKVHFLVEGLVLLLVAVPVDSASLIARARLVVAAKQQLVVVLPGSIQSKDVERQYKDSFQ